MKSRTVVLVIMAACMAAFFVSSAFSEDKKAPSQEEMMAIMTKYAQPAENHKLLEPLVGKWDLLARWWQDPSAPADTSRGTSESKWILGGRYVLENVDGLAMGMPLNGMSVMGFDNYKKKFISFWIDNMSTAFLLSSGIADSAGKIFSLSGTYDDFITGQKDKPYRTVTKIISNDQHVYEMYEVGPGGKEFKNFEVIFTRMK